MSFSLSPFTLPRAAPAAKKGGSLSPPAPLSCGAAAPGGRGTREAHPRFAFSQRTRKICVVPRLMRRFGKVSNHKGGVLCPLRERRCGCQKHVTPRCHPPPSERVTPMRRHLLDPQTRKSSIIPRSLGEPVSCSDSSPHLRGTGP